MKIPSLRTLRNKKSNLYFGFVLARPRGYDSYLRWVWIAAPTKEQAETLAHLQKQENETIEMIYLPQEVQPLTPPEVPFKKGDYIKRKDGPGGICLVKGIGKTRINFIEVNSYVAEGMHHTWRDKKDSWWSAQLEIASKEEFDQQIVAAKKKYCEWHDQ